ncbi:hypothetical protein [Nocardia sp. NPDC047648]|uniref:hypothetical protein n=1 Tax=Nocardia sp. NPDC047648 TaxID=3155625 RepID=UPI00340973B4
MSNVEQPPARTAVHSIRPGGSNGRVVDKAVLTAFDWRPGDLLSWRIAGGLIVITRPGYGRCGVTQGWAPVAAGAGPARGGHPHPQPGLAGRRPQRALLVVYPPRVLDQLLARRFAA